MVYESVTMYFASVIIYVHISSVQH